MSVIRSMRTSFKAASAEAVLVPQDPRDEPASELLKRIDKEKARLVKAGESLSESEADTSPLATKDNSPADGRNPWVQTGDIMAGRDVNFGLSPEQVAARSADAAKNSAEAAVGALRPWVTFTNIDIGDFVFAAGLARVSLTFQLTNTGRSPAQDVSVHSIGRLSPISQEEQYFAINSVIGNSTGGGYAVFPGDHHKFLNMVMFRNEEIVTAPFF